MNEVELTERIQELAQQSLHRVRVIERIKVNWAFDWPRHNGGPQIRTDRVDDGSDRRSGNR